MSRKKKQKPTTFDQQEAQAGKARIDDLEAQADAILRKDNERMLERLQRDLEMAEVIKRNTELMEQIQKDLIQPRNDPEYLKALEAKEATRNQVANKVDTVHIVPDGNKTWLGVGLTDPRHHANALETARQLGDLLEAKVITHET